jgi:hypothetical protein
VKGRWSDAIRLDGSFETADSLTLMSGELAVKVQEMFGLADEP